MLVVRQLRTPSCRIKCSKGAQLECSPLAESSTAARRRFTSSYPVLEGRPTVLSPDSSPPRRSSSDKATGSKKAGPPRRSKVSFSSAKRLALALKEASPLGPLPPTDQAIVAESTQAIFAAPDSSYGKRIPLSVNKVPNTPPSISDLLRIQPQPPKVPLWHEHYPGRYDKVRSTLDNAFTRTQMKSFVKDLGLGEPHWAMRKGDLLSLIMANWGWEKARERVVEKAEDEQVFDISSPELFLMLRDRGLMQDILTRQKIGFNIGAQGEDKNKLPVRGSTRALQWFGSMLQGRRKGLITDEWAIGDMSDWRPTEDLLSTVSNVTVAYVERMANNMLRATTFHPRSVLQARQLFSIAELRTKSLSQYRPLMAAVPSSESSTKYTLFPYQASEANPIPWTDTSISNPAMFRLSRVGRWSVKVSRREAAHQVERLGDSEVFGITGSDENTTWADLLNLAWRDNAQNPRRVVAQFGHFPHTVLGEGTSIFSSPLPDESSPDRAIACVKGLKSTPIFIPCRTPSMARTALSLNPSVRRRLSYRHTDLTKTLTFTYTYVDAPSQEGGEPVAPAAETLNLDMGEESWQVKLSKFLEKMETGGSNEDDKDQGGEATPAESTPAESVGEALGDQVAAAAPIESIEERLERHLVGESSRGVKEIDMLLPDRPIDLRMTTASPSPLSSDSIPKVIVDYFRSVLGAEGKAPSKLPVAPTELTLDHPTLGGQYRIEADEELRVAETCNRSGVVVRDVRVIDKALGLDREIAHTELEYQATEGGEVPEAFWTELANVSRELAPVSAPISDARYLL